MAKLISVSVAILLLFFLLLAGSRANLPENGDAAKGDRSDQRRRTATILLPSEKPSLAHEAATPVQLDHDHVASDSELAHGSVPLTLVSFHPINRHFRRGHLPLRRRHRCHHGYRHHWAPLLRDREGTHDVILARRFPGRGVWVHHGKPRTGHVDLTWQTHAKKPHYLHRHAMQAEHRVDAEYHRRRHHGEAGMEEEDGGLFMKIRKFLGHF